MFSDINFYSPQFLIDELDEVDICAKAKIGVEEFSYIFEELVLPEIELIEAEIYHSKIEGRFYCRKLLTVLKCGRARHCEYFEKKNEV